MFQRFELHVPQRHPGLIEKAIFFLIENFCAPKIHIQKRMYVTPIASPPPDNILSSGFSSTLKNSKEGKRKEVTETNSWKIANTEPVDSVNAIYKPEIDKNTKMKRKRNMKCIEMKPFESDWTEEVKLTENWDDYTDKFFYVLSEFKDT